MRFFLPYNVFVFVAFVCCFFEAFPQEIYPQNTDWSLTLRKCNYMVKCPCNNEKNNYSHTSVKPWMAAGKNDTACLLKNCDDRFYFSENFGKNKKRIGRKLTGESLFRVNDTDFTLTADPLFNFNLRHTTGDSGNNHTRNTRGLLIRGTIGKNLYFETSYYETQADFVPYINDYVKKYAVVPGQIRVKDFKSSSYDYGVAFGLLSYTLHGKAGNTLNFQLGNDKNFFGDGYRSLLLSDFSSPYPFFKVTGKYRKLSYTCLFTSFQNISEGGIIYDTVEWNQGYQKKTGSFHYLSYFVNKRINISLFEGTLWQVAQTGGRRFNPDFFNPVILVHSAESGLNGKNNTMLGLNLLCKPLNKFHLYGQIAFDDIRLNKISEKKYFHNRYGVQTGLEGFDLFGVENLNLQAEYNYAKPYMYSHKNISQSYTHYNQPLAHPLGAGFNEGVGIIRYRYNKYFFHAQFNIAAYRGDTANSCFGKNIFMSDEMASTSGTGVNTSLKYADVCLSYLLNPAASLNIFFGASYRGEKNYLKNAGDKFVYAGIRTSLRNEYFDF